MEGSMEVCGVEKNITRLVCPGRWYPRTIVVEAVGQRLWEIILDRVGCRSVGG
jgi:hypothetical protein